MTSLTLFGQQEAIIMGWRAMLADSLMNVCNVLCIKYNYY